ncbi:glyoxylase-like metal-dependent hydrolase (beta-lactamase superfamily II) [Microbacterium resistens]|uniref:Glyoxylase-like metal-dependent hydrolase (Beta-lactamase superfamily II) n=1 Tax=Microbacterium resistens TaxID=156977 RepID=A0ABU1SES0_9MICO|nr:MBL fold metallo-hydrolase [Microbacterium resistens]MDR6868107.1 glyoxylase-like metal-dependent hydrolase (beta-lactamase superfamily II) [Microbacterium resistens]
MTAKILLIGDDIVAMHAILTDEGVTLIDAGLPGDLKRLRTALADAGRSLDDIRGIVLTHGDSDHIGVAERLRAEHGVPVFVHAADAERAQGHESTHAPGGAWRIGPVLRFLGGALLRGGFRTRHLAEVRSVADGDVLDLPGRPEILAIPGHSPGSVAIRVAEADALFLGDAITTRNVLTGERGILIGPFSDEPERTLPSLSRLKDLPETRILPGHGPEFRGTMADVLAALSASKPRSSGSSR